VTEHFSSICSASAYHDAIAHQRVQQQHSSDQRRIFIFGALGYFKLGAILEGLRRLTSYKLALNVLITFTEQVVPNYKHTTLFWIPSISGTKTVTIRAGL